MVIFKLRDTALEVLLIRRREEPFKDRWALPGGFVNMDESLDDAARRELQEETGVSAPVFEQLYTFGEPNRDPRGRVISVAYLALLPPGNLSVRGADDAAEAGWFKIGPPPPLAFDHDQILATALQRLRQELGSSDAGMRLLPAEFTLSDLQAAYEGILGEQLDKRNFRRKILHSDVLVETGRMRSGDGRPAKLYRYTGHPERASRSRPLFP
jgi:8-oxo-dGTP diphosphatase